MSISSGRRLFFFISGLLLLSNLLVLNDVATVWDGAEAAFLYQAHLDPEAPVRTPAHLLSRLMTREPTNTFLLRLPGVFIILLSLAGIYFLSKPVLGPKAARWTILVLGSSFLLPNLGKAATLDAWIFCWHALGFLLLLRFLKQPAPLWRFSFYLVLGLGLWTSPLSTALLFALLPAVLYRRHSRGNRLWRLQPWAAILLIGAGLQSAGWIDWTGREQYLAPFSAGFYLYSLLGMFPFLGFLLGGLWEMASKLRRGEELALLNASLLGATLVAQSPALQLVLALVIAKQMHVYFHENYPYRGLVRTGAILHLILVFLLATILMLGGFFRFEGVGFRSALAFGAVYWMLSFVAVIGLFSGNRRYIWGATIGSGLLPVLLFWLQVYPLIESRRDLPERLVDAVAELREPEQSVYLIPEGSWAKSNEMLYLKSAYPSLGEAEEIGERGDGVYIVPEERVSPAPSLRDSMRVSGWNDRFQETEWVLLDYRSGALKDQIEQYE